MGLLDAILDPQFRSDVRGGLLGAVNRGAVGGLLGAPVDMTAGLLNAALMAGGYLGNKAGLLSADQMPQPVETPVGGSEWIGQQMQKRGMVSDQRNPVAELIAGVAFPGAMVKAGPAVYAAEQAGKRGAFAVGQKGADMAEDYLARQGLRPSIFMGDKSQTWDKAAAAKAQALESAGTDPRVIWKETGTFKGADGKWRQEIDDSGAALETANAKAVEWMTGPGPAEYPVGAVSNVISHNGAFDAYRGLADIKARLRKGTSGSYIENNNGFGEALELPAMFKGGQYADPIQTRSVTLHELQHAVQNREGFARGGNAAEFASGPMFDGRARDLAGELSQAITGGLGARPDEIVGSIKYADPAALSPILKKYGLVSVDDAVAFLKAEDVKRTPFGQYQRLAGEAEARAVQSRMNLNPQQRRELFPFDSYDVPINSLIVR